MTDNALQHFSDEQLRTELQRRVSEIPEALAGGYETLLELPAGSWGHHSINPASDVSLANEYKQIMRLGLVRLKELLSIPLDPADPSYGAVLRGINGAVSTFLAFLSKTNDELLRPPPKDDSALFEELMAWGRRKYDVNAPMWVQELMKLTDEQVDELLAKRREELEAWARTKAEIRARHNKETS